MGARWIGVVVVALGLLCGGCPGRDPAAARQRSSALVREWEAEVSKGPDQDPATLRRIIGDMEVAFEAEDRPEDERMAQRMAIAILREHCDGLERR
jgi:hypothetical protein